MPRDEFDFEDEIGMDREDSFDEGVMNDDGTYNLHAFEDMRGYPEGIIDEMFCNSIDPEGDAINYANMILDRVGEE